MNENISLDPTEPNDNGPDIKQLIFRYLQYWPWFILSILICLSGAYLYLRYTIPVYSAKNKIKILDQKDNGLDLSGLQGTTSLFNMSKIKLGNEIQLMKSRRMMGKVVKDLKLNTSYYTPGTIKSLPLFGNDLPFEVIWITKDSSSTKGTPLYTLNFKSGNKFEIHNERYSSGKHKFYDTIKLPRDSVVIEKNPDYQASFDDLLGRSYQFKYTPTESLIGHLSGGIQIMPTEDMTSDILISTITGANTDKNEAILNSLAEQFNQDGIKDKQKVSKRTEQFVESRLASLYKQLDTVETGLVNYKMNQGIVSVEQSTQELSTKEGTAESNRFDIQNQIAITENFRETLKNSEPYSLLPSNIGINSGSINQLATSYNQAVEERNNKLVSATPQNPVIKNINAKLNRLKANIFDNIKSYLRSQKILLENLKQRENASSGKLRQIPSTQKHIKTIERQQQIKEQLYLFLLQRRETAALSYAVTSPTIKVVDYAYTTGRIKPKPNVIYLGAIGIGLIIPFIIVYLRFAMDNKVNNKNQVKKLLKDIPIVAEIPQLKKSKSRLIKHNDRSILAESFRILRTNLAFFQPPKKQHEYNKGQVVFVTSTTKGEGKTFAAVNLSISLASTGKKTLLIGCDLRNPQIHNYIKREKSEVGVSNYLYNISVDLPDLVIKRPLDFEGLDVVMSGEIPPNPAELLMNGRFDELLEKAKREYDFVVVDTAPTVLVTDTLLISKLADVFLYMVRANVTETKLLQHVRELKKDEKLKNMGVVVNGVEEKAGYGYGYNYGYGYGYGESHK